MNLRVGLNEINNALFSALAESEAASEPMEAAVTNSLTRAATVVSNAVTSTASSYVGQLGFDKSLLVQSSLLSAVSRMHLHPGMLEVQRPIDWASLVKVLPNPLFVKGKGEADSVDMNDIDQNRLGNCWMMAPMAALAQKDPQAIKNMIKDNGDGTYTVTFKERSPIGFGVTEKKITVTADFPGGISGSGHAGIGDKNIGGKGEIWPLIIEKAYAQYKGGYDKLNGGNPNEFLEAMTGRFSTGYEKPFSLLGGGLTPNRLQSDFDSGKPIVFSTPATGTLGYGLVNNHCYAAKRVYTDATGRKMVELYNPWGNSHPRPIPYDDFINNFSKISVGNEL